MPLATGIRLVNAGSVPSTSALTGPLGSHQCCASSHRPFSGGGLSPCSQDCGLPYLTTVAVSRPRALPWESCWNVTFSTSQRHLGETRRQGLFYPVATHVGTGITVRPLPDRNNPLAAFLSLSLCVWSSGPFAPITSHLPRGFSLEPGTQNPCPQFLSSYLPYTLEPRGPSSN